jgi:uncharacterized protein YjiS (DUF1127 family)
MTIFSQIRAARRRRLAIRDLKALSAGTLLDIGIEPGRIDAVVSEAFRDHPAPRTERSHPAAFARPGISNGAWPYPWRRAG